MGTVCGQAMDYQSALQKLLGLVDHERIVSATRERVRYDLRRMETLLARLGNPYLGVPTVHIAGTKGKGSTAAMCAAVLRAAGYRTGLFTSPHMHTFRERISLDGDPVSEEEFSELVEEIWPDLQWVSSNGDHGEVTMFEALTAMAFCHFRRRADFQVLEVGLGGRLDTTNLSSPRVCAITSISLDHTSVLGDTIESIAGEKAGIIKSGVPVVTAPQVPEAMEVLVGVSRDKGAELIVAGKDLTWRGGPKDLNGQQVVVGGRLGSYDLRTPLLGDWQQENVAVAVGALEVLIGQSFAISDGAIQQGMASVRWPCRLEVLSRSPLVVCDGAHNPYSAAKLRDSVPAYFGRRRVILVVGVSQDKNLQGIVGELKDLGQLVIATRSRHPRAAPVEALADAFRGHGVETVLVEGVDRAMARALEEAGDGDMVLATGSLFVAAEARETILGIEPELYPQLPVQSSGSSC